VDGLKTRIIDHELAYDGTQLAPHWIYRNYDLMGDAVVAFIGPATVTTDHMVDLQDVKANAPIYSPKMLHFIGEWFHDSLDIAVLTQNLFIREVYERLLHRGIGELSRRGNDIYYQARKLSVSIATKSSVSVLMHTGLNIDTDGTPVPTAGLTELGLKPFIFAQEVLDSFARDHELWRQARVKVLAR